MEKIIKNMAKCRRCGDVVESRYTHDFRTCKCGAITVDGGREYIRRGYKYDKEDIIDLSIIVED